VYAPNELSHRPRSSTDGKPIVRLRAPVLRALCAREHAELWARYLADGSTPTLDEILAAEDAEDEPAIEAPAWLDDDDVEDAGMWIAEDDEGDDGRVEDEPEREPRIRRPERAGRRRHPERE
jgi:hypothetical protein